MAVDTTLFMGKCLELLTNGDVLGALICPFNTAMTFAGFNYMYIFAFIIVEVAVYMKTQNITAVGLIGILTGAAFAMVLPPEAVQIAYLIIAGSFTAVMYKTFKSR